MLQDWMEGMADMVGVDPPLEPCATSPAFRPCCTQYHQYPSSTCPHSKTGCGWTVV